MRPSRDWYQGVDGRVNFCGVGDPGLTFGWFDLELGGGEGRLPERPHDVESVGGHNKCDIIDVREDVNEGEEVGGEGGAEKLDGRVQTEAESCG